MTPELGAVVRLAAEKNLWLVGTVVRVDLREGRPPRCWVRWSDDGRVGGPFEPGELEDGRGAAS